MHMDLEDLPWKPREIASRNRFLVCVERLVRWHGGGRKVIAGYDIDDVVAEAKKYCGHEKGKEWKVKKPMKVTWFGKFKIVLARKNEEDLKGDAEWRQLMKPLSL